MGDHEERDPPSLVLTRLKVMGPLLSSLPSSDTQNGNYRERKRGMRLVMSEKERGGSVWAWAFSHGFPHFASSPQTRLPSKSNPLLSTVNNLIRHSRAAIRTQRHHLHRLWRPTRRRTQRQEWKFAQAERG